MTPRSCSTARSRRPRATCDKDELRKAIEKARLQVGARRLQVRAEPHSDPELLSAGRGEGRRRLPAQDGGHDRRERSGQARRQVPDDRKPERHRSAAGPAGYLAGPGWPPPCKRFACKPQGVRGARFRRKEGRHEERSARHRRGACARRRARGRATEDRQDRLHRHASAARPRRSATTCGIRSRSASITWAASSAACRSR